MGYEKFLALVELDMELDMELDADGNIPRSFDDPRGDMNRGSCFGAGSGTASSHLSTRTLGRCEDNVGRRPPVELVRCRDSYGPGAANGPHHHTLLDGQRIVTQHAKRGERAAVEGLQRQLEDGSEPTTVSTSGRKRKQCGEAGHADNDERALLETAAASIAASAESTSGGGANGGKASSTEEGGALPKSTEYGGRVGPEYQMAHDELSVERLNIRDPTLKPVEMVKIWHPSWQRNGGVVALLLEAHMVAQYVPVVGVENVMRTIAMAESYEEAESILSGELGATELFSTHPFGSVPSSVPEESFRPLTAQEEQIFNRGMQSAASEVAITRVFEHLKETLLPHREVADLVAHFQTRWVNNEKLMRDYHTSFREAVVLHEARMCAVCQTRKAPFRLTACSDGECDRAFHPKCGVQALPEHSTDTHPSGDTEKTIKSRETGCKEKGKGKKRRGPKGPMFCSVWCRDDAS